MDDLKPLDPNYQPRKTITQLLQESVQQKGGLAQLASAEQMINPPPSLEAVA